MFLLLIYILKLSSSLFSAPANHIFHTVFCNSYVFAELSSNIVSSFIFLCFQIYLPKYKNKENAAQSEKKLGFLKNHISTQKLSYQNGHGGSLYSPPAAGSSLCVSSPCEVSLMMMVGDSDTAAASRGICSDLAILDSAFLLSQVIPSLLMGSLVQFTQSVTTYMASATGFGLVAIYFATKVIFDKSDMAMYSL